MNAITQEVASQTEERGPHDASQGVEEEKARPAHLIGPGQESGPGSQHGDKAPKEDDLAAVLHEEVLPQFQLAFIQTNIATVAAQETVAALASDPEAEIIAQDGATGGSHDHERNGKMMRCPCINGGNEQHRLAREGNACALDGNKDENCPIAVGGKQMQEIVRSHRDHGVILPFLSSRKENCIRGNRLSFSFDDTILSATM